MTRDDCVVLSERDALHRECACTDQKSSQRLSRRHMEEALACARPRLLRLATVRGITPDAIDDVVQETLLEAWQYRDRLRTPDQLDVWLDGICRNICRRWQTRQQKLQSRSIPLPFATGEEALGEEPPTRDLPDAMLLDPAEALVRQDLEVLLDRALAYLSPENRKAVEMHYLLEVPQREAARCLGMTISALQARLHRARRQLQHILSSTLRADAETFGLAMAPQLGDEITTNWRASREWCDTCGRHCLYGIFQPLPNGKVMLRMRCPECSLRQNNSALLGFLPSGAWRSFRPAIKRIEREYQECIWKRYQAGRPGICARCGAENMVQLISHGEYMTQFSPGCSISREESFFPLFVFQCHACSYISTGCAWNQAFFHPLMQRFKDRHPRSIIENVVLDEYAGCPAFHLRVGDIASVAHINAFLHTETVQVLAVIEE